MSFRADRDRESEEWEHPGATWETFFACSLFYVVGYVVHEILITLTGRRRAKLPSQRSLIGIGAAVSLTAALMVWLRLTH